MREYCATLIPRVYFDITDEENVRETRAIILLDGCALMGDARMWDAISRIFGLREFVDVYVADCAIASDLYHCSCERAQPFARDARILPDVGAMGYLIAAVWRDVARIHYICKPFLQPIMCDYYVGDGDADRRQKICCAQNAYCAKIIIAHVAELRDLFELRDI
jgi:hypothetical protein